ncbi:MAG: LacI family DNA-binding transcriptional regulator, partial [Lentisphaeria bacterium]|nr:LacI family DNA-binding transcriptional regulator [Lentisphaeria bacterium]
MSITLKDIAQQAGVSQMTVSRILNGKTQGQVSEEVIPRVRSIASELKYRSNRTDRKLNCLLNRDAQDAELPKVTVLTPAPDFLEMPGRSARILNEVLPGIFQAAAEAGGMVEILPVSKANDPNKIEWPWLKTFGSGSRILALSPWFMVPLAELSRRG